MADEEYGFTLDTGALQADTSGGWAGNVFDWTSTFVQSAISSGTQELVGITPGENIERWRMNNPVAGIFSELAGMAVPYAGWAKGMRVAGAAVPGLKVFENVAKGLEATSAARPFVATGGAEIARFLPFEAGRVAISQVIGDKSFGEMATEAGVNLVLGGALAGGIGTLGAASRRGRSLADVHGSLDASLPPQLLLRKIDEVATANPDIIPQLGDDVFRIEERARSETVDRYVSKEISGVKDQINKLFRPGVSGTIEKRMPVSGSDPGTFATVDDWHKAAMEAGLEPSKMARDTQFPRFIEFSKTADTEYLTKLDKKLDAAIQKLDHDSLVRDMPDETYVSRRTALESKALGRKTGPGPATRAATRVEKNITDNLQPVGDGWFLAREPEDGMFVMARKYRGEVGKPSSTDAWVLFRTDKPGNFSAKSQQFQNLQVAREKWITGKSTVEDVLNEAPDSLIANINKTMSTVPYERYNEVSTLRGGPKGVAQYVEKLPGYGRLKGNAASQHMSDFVTEYLTPMQKQLRKSTRGNYTLNMGKMIQDSVENFAQRIFQGELKLTPGKNALRQLVLASEESGTRAIKNVIDDIYNEGLQDEFMELVRKGISPQMAEGLVRDGKLRPRTAELAKELDFFDGIMMTELNRFERAAGQTPTKRRQGHYGISRKWDGSFFHAIKDEAGKNVGIAAGHSARQASENAKKLAEQLSKETGRPHRIDPTTFTRNNPSGIPRDLIPFVTNPGFTMERANVRGFKWDLETPTREQLLEAFNGSVKDRARRMGNLGREALLGRHVAALSVEDPFALKVVSTRFNQMSGVEGEFSKLQNRLADKVLAPYIGSNSASKIVQVTNEALMHLQLGFMKLSHPITNVIGVIQTVAPELAFVMNAVPETVAGSYHFAVPAVGQRGTAGVMGVLNPMKLMGSAMRETWKPSAQTTKLLERAVNERAIDARLIEDYVGQNRTKLSNLKGAVKGPKEFASWVLSASEFLPATSERFARVFSFNAGVVAARDILKMADEDQIYRFAKQFTERTNYLYSAADRPLVFTSPLGSSMGLFKNWMMNYTHTMMEYTNLGLTQNTWSPLMWQTMGTFATAGAAGTPIYWAADAASKIFADKSLMQWSYDEFSQQTSDALMFGLPAALTGISLSSQMTSPGANPMRDAAQMFSAAIYTRAAELGGAVKAGVDHWRVTGEHPGADPDVRNQLIKAFAPVNLYRYFATQEDGVVRNLGTDLPSAKGLSGMDIMWYRMGMQPLALEKQLTVANELYARRENMRAATQRFGDTYREAMIANDSAAMERIIRQATMLGVDVSAVLKSAVTRQRNESKAGYERLAKPQVIQEYSNVLGLQ